MAALAIAAVGSAIGGSLIATPILGMTGATIGWMAGSLLGSLLIKQPNQHGPRLEDRTVVGTAYGQAVPWIAGSPRIAGQYCWVSSLREIASTQKVGKGGGQKVTTYTYECDVLILLTENMTEGVARDWINAELIRNDLTVKDGVWNGITIYTGADDQLPDPTYEAAEGDAPAFRGRTSIVIRGLQLGNGKQLPNIEHQPVKEGQVYTDDDYQDYSGNNVPVSIATGTSPSSWGGTVKTPAKFVASGKFNGGNIVTPGQALWVFEDTGGNRYLPQDWSIRAWLYDIGDGSYSNWVLSFGNNDGNPPGLRIRRLAAAFGVQAMEANLRGTGGSPSFTLTSNVALPKNQWCFFELTKIGTQVVMFLDGVVVAQITNFNPSNLPMPCFPSRWSLGGQYGANVAWHGYIDDFVYTDGAGGHWNAYTPPTTPHVPDANTLLYIPFNRPGGLIPGTEPLGSVIEQLLDRAEYDPNEYFVHPDLYNIDLYGYQTGDVTSTRAHLETLRPFGKYECYSTDKLYIFPRATTPAGSIDWKDLGASEGVDPVEPFPMSFGSEKELPAQIVLRYRNVASDWNVGTEFSDRLISSQVSTQTAEMAFGMTPEQAKSTVESMLLDAMAGLGRVTVKTGGRKYAKFNPGDIVTVTNPAGRTFRLRILTKRDSLIIIEFECVLDDASVLNPPAITYEGYVSTQDPVRVAPTIWETLNIPALRDADAESPGPYVAITPSTSSDTDEWPGAVFVRARLPEAYEQQFITGDQCVIGATLTALSTFDRGSTAIQKAEAVRVRVRGELSSSTWADFFVDRTINAALIGDEPVRFIRADFVSNDGMFRIYDISLILRGQLGQEHEIVEHPIGTRFVLLDNAIRRMVNETTDIGVEQQIKAVTLNTLLSSIDAEDFTESGIALTPYSPWRLRALQSAAGIDIGWDRRSRLVARYTETGTFAPVGELIEAYRLKVYDGSTLVRTENLTARNWTYSTADIALDGFTSGDPITITVQQLSDRVGEGFAETVETEAP